jgi:hypothetical protein
MSTAVGCIREVFPASAIKTVRVENPLRITIAVDVLGRSQNVWTCKQQNLFQRNPKRRRRAMDSIRECLANLKEQISSGSLATSRTNSPTSSTSSINTSERIVEVGEQACSYPSSRTRNVGNLTLSSKDKDEVINLQLPV